jgi:hypothetical protein
VTRILISICTSLIAAISTAQLSPRPILLTGPEAQGASLQQAEEVIQLAAKHGYNGVAFGGGVGRVNDPTFVDVSGIQTATHLAMTSGLKYICWRLDVDIPNNQAWADAYNGGDTWQIQTRPVSSTWTRIAQIWQAIRNASAQQIVADGGDPNKVLIFVLGNEPGIGGTGSASLGPWGTSGFYYSLFQSTGDPTWFLVAFPPELEGQPEGYIEPGYWTMLRSVVSQTSLGGAIYCVSFEGSENSIAGQINSTTGPDAQWLFANTNGYALNIFGPNTRRQTDSVTGTVTKAPATPLQSAGNYTARVDKILTTIKGNPILTNEHLLITEFNLSSGRVPDNADLFPYREEMLKQVMVYPPIDGAMMFTAYSGDQTTSGVNLFTRTVVNGVVTITPIGSNAVGPAYINMVP